MNDLDTDQQGYLATRLIGLMIFRARQDGDASDPVARQEAQRWLSSQDKGLASMAMGCQHLANRCQRLADTQRALMAERLGPRVTGETLQDADTWQVMCQAGDVSPDKILETIEALATLAYPNAAPVNEVESFMPPHPGSPPWGPGR